MLWQSCGNWHTEHPRLAYRDFVQALLHQFDWWELLLNTRESNGDADQLANAAIDKESDGYVHLLTHNFAVGEYRLYEDNDQRVNLLIDRFEQCDLAYSIHTSGAAAVRRRPTPDPPLNGLTHGRFAVNKPRTVGAGSWATACLARTL